LFFLYSQFHLLGNVNVFNMESEAAIKTSDRDNAQLNYSQPFSNESSAGYNSRTNNFAERYGIPALIVAGTQKGGTDAVREYLMNHPQMLGTERKETHFFDMYCKGECSNPEVIQQNRDLYARTYWNVSEIEQNPQLLAFEKTPVYILQPKIMHDIKLLVPWAKILIVLRDPIERAYSHFKMNYMKKPKKRDIGLKRVSFEACVQSDMDQMNRLGMLNETFLQSSGEVKRKLWDELLIKRKRGMAQSQWCDSMITRGLYSLQLRPIFDDYGPEAKDKILVIRSEDLRPNPMTNLTVTDFLGIDELNQIGEEKIHATVDLVGPLKNETISTLRKLYAPYIKELHSILGDGWEDPWPILGHSEAIITSTS